MTSISAERHLHFDVPLDEVTAGQVTSFVFSCAAILFAFNPFIGQPIPVAVIPTWLLALLSLYFLVKEQPSVRIWVSWAMSLVCAACATFAFLSSRPDIDMSAYILTFRPSAILGVVMFAATATMLAAHRYNVGLYVMLMVAVGIVAYVGSTSPLVSATVVSLYALCLVSLNYIIKLVLDHARDARLGMRFKREHPREFWKLVSQAIWPLLIVFVLIASGAAAHEWMQNQLKEKVYESELLPRSQSDVTEDANRDMRLDSHAALNAYTASIRESFYRQIKELSENGQLSADNVPLVLAEVLRANPVPTIKSADCNKLHVPPPRILGIKMGGGFGGLADACRSAMTSLSSSISAIYAAGIARLQHEVQELVTEGKNAMFLTEKQARIKGDRVISEAHLFGVAAIEKVFLVVDGLYVFGWAILISALVGATALVLARRLFDHTEGSVFSLGAEGRSLPLEFTVIQAPTHSDGILRVADFPIPSGPPYWYIYASQFKLSRNGRGLEGLTIPQLFSCVFQRLFRVRFSMQRINATEAADARSKGQDGAGFGAGKGATLTLACIRVKPGQQIVFKFGSLVGFSAGVKLRSTYSTHVGLYLLGLGTFYSYAEGDGWLVLGIDMGSFKPSERSANFEYPNDLVAWDRRAKFSVNHTTNVGQHWFTESQVVPKSKDGAVLFITAGHEAPGPVRYLARLFGYLLVPF